MSKKDNYVCFFSMLSFPFFTFPPFFFYLILIVCVYMLTILVSKASKMLNKNGQSEHSLPCHCWVQIGPQNGSAGDNVLNKRVKSSLNLALLRNFPMQLCLPRKPLPLLFIPVVNYLCKGISFQLNLNSLHQLKDLYFADYHIKSAHSPAKLLSSILGS